MTDYRFYLNNREVLILQHKSDDQIKVKYLDTNKTTWTPVSDLTRQEVAP